MGENKPTVDELDSAMGFILSSVADGLVSVEHARRLIRTKGVVPAARQIRKATRNVRKQDATTHRDVVKPGKKKRK